MEALGSVKGTTGFARAVLVFAFICYLKRKKSIERCKNFIYKTLVLLKPIEGSCLIFLFIKKSQFKAFSAQCFKEVGS